MPDELTNTEPEGSAGEATPQPNPAPEPKPEPKPKPAEKPKGKTISDEEYAELKSLREARAEAERAKAKAEEDAAKKRGEFDKLIKDRDDKLAAEAKRAEAAEERAKAYTKGKDLATALAGQPLIAKGAEQLIRLWSDRFEVVPDGDGWKTQTLDGKSVDEFVAEALASDEYSHFVPADKRGGTGAKGGNRPAPTASPSDRPATIVEAINAKVAEQTGKVPEYYRGTLGRRSSK